MDLGLQGTRCIVTGASDGIGAATALALAREGAAVGLVARYLHQGIPADLRRLERRPGPRRLRLRSGGKPNAKMPEILGQHRDSSRQNPARKSLRATAVFCGESRYLKSPKA